jgi:hypothetical protein
LELPGDEVKVQEEIVTVEVVEPEVVEPEAVPKKFGKRKKVAKKVTEEIPETANAEKIKPNILEDEAQVPPKESPRFFYEEVKVENAPVVEE